MEQLLRLLKTSEMRDLTASEQLELELEIDNVPVSDSDDENNYSNIGIGGSSYSAGIHTEKAGGNHENRVSADQNNNITDSDDSTEETEALPDPRILQIIEDFREAENQASFSEYPPEADQNEASAVEPNRGMRYTAQNKRFQQIWWSRPSDSEQNRATIAKTTRKNYIASCNGSFSSKAEAFKRLIPESIVEAIALDTNKKAKRAYESNRHLNDPKNMRYWTDVNADELYAYIAILLYAGAEKSCSVQAKDLFHESHMPFYRAVMSLARFEQITRFIRFDDTRTRPARLQSDKLAAFRHVWSLFQKNLSEHFIPSKEITIDEQLVTTRGRCSFKQYIPSKPGKYGIKIFWLVDATTNYPLAGEIYLGTQPGEQRARNIAHDLVLRLSDRYLDKGYNITMDNFFTSVPLAKELIRRKTTLNGTIRSNKPELPKQFTDSNEIKRREAHSTIFAFSDNLCLASYVSNTKKNVLLLSTAHADEAIDAKTKKPQVILDYNATKGGVDTFDQMNRIYTCKRKTNRWPVTLFYNMLDVGALAAYRIFQLSNPAWCTSSNTRKLFLKSLATELADAHIQNRIAKSSLHKSVKTSLKLIGYDITNITILPEILDNKTKQRCEACKRNRKGQKGDTKTTAVCDVCRTATCSKHYIRVCEQCYTTSADPVADEDENPNLNNLSVQSTSSSVPQLKRPRTHSPN